MDSFQELKDLFHVLGNPNRLKLFNILMTGVHCNCELSDQTGMAINLISHHMRVLQAAGLVKSIRGDTDARWIYYSVNEEKIKSVQTEINAFFDPERMIDREPICPPCKTKTKETNNE
jgi:ArsR family transcriptional regulator